MKLPRARSEGEETLALHLRTEPRIPAPVRQFRFCARRWTFDFAWPELNLAVEVEGGTWTQGRHSRGSGFARDAEKYNAAALLGWRVFRCTTAMVRSGEALRLIRVAHGIAEKMNEGEKRSEPKPKCRGCGNALWTSPGAGLCDACWPVRPSESGSSSR